MPHATIFKPQQPYKRCIHETFKEFPASSLALLDTLLAIEPADRGSAAQALASEVSGLTRSDNSPFRSVTSEINWSLFSFLCFAQFFNTKPLACDPSSLPQYPPSKEFDAKIRDDEARRYVFIPS